MIDNRNTKARHVAIMTYVIVLVVLVRIYKPSADYVSVFFLYSNDIILLNNLIQKLRLNLPGSQTCFLN